MTTKFNIPLAILVGGFGTRLRSVINDRPKPLAEIGGKPFLHWILEQAANAGVREVILLTGYGHTQIKTSCGDGQQFGLHIHYSEEHDPRGTAGALAQGHEILSQYSEFLLMNGDTYCPTAINSFLMAGKIAPSYLGKIGVIEVNDAARYGSINFDQHNLIKSFTEKAQTGSAWINAGIYQFSQKILDYIPQEQNYSLERELLPDMLAAGKQFQALKIKGEMIDIGLPESYHTLQQRFAKEK